MYLCNICNYGANSPYLFMAHVGLTQEHSLTVIRFLAAGVTLAALAACGGGSGGDTPPVAGGGVTSATALKLTSTNYVGAAQETLSTVNTLQDTSSVLPSFATGAQVANQAVLLQFARAQVPKLQGWAKTTSQLVTGAVQTDIENCPGGGTLTLSGNDANNNDDFDVGETISVSAANCHFDGSVLNGTVAFTLKSLTGSLSTNVYSVGFSLVFTNLTASTSAGTDSVNGAMTLALQSTAYNTSVVTLTTGSDLTVAGNYGGTAFTRSLNNYATVATTSPLASGYSISTTASGTLVSSSLGAKSVALSTVAPWVQTNVQQYPGSGQIRLTGADGSQVRITAVANSQVLIELDADGNNSYESNTTKAWSELL